MKSALRSWGPTARVISEQRWRRRVRIDPVLRACIEHSPQGGTVIDVGASEGLYALAMRRAVGRRGSVIALEPNPISFAALRRRTWRAGIEARNQAASVSGGMVSLHVPESASTEGAVPGLGSIVPLADPAARALVHDVEAVRLDDVVSEAGDRVRLVKIDVEGWEDQVLAGAQRLIERDRPVLIVEIEERHLAARGVRASAVIEAVASMGYGVSAITDGESIPWESFRFELHQRSEDVCGGVASPRYLNNFLFIPSEGARAAR